MSVRATSSQASHGQFSIKIEAIVRTFTLPMSSVTAIGRIPSEIWLMISDESDICTLDAVGRTSKYMYHRILHSPTSILRWQPDLSAHSFDLPGYGIIPARVRRLFTKYFAFASGNRLIAHTAAVLSGTDLVFDLVNTSRIRPIDGPHLLKIDVPRYFFIWWHRFLLSQGYQSPLLLTAENNDEFEIDEGSVNGDTAGPGNGLVVEDEDSNDAGLEEIDVNGISADTFETGENIEIDVELNRLRRDGALNSKIPLI